MCAVLETGHNTTSTHRMRDDTGDKRIDRTRIIRMRRADPRRVQKESLLRPCFKLWSRQRQETLWFFASMVFYVVNQRRALLVLEYTEFMGRTRWKIYHDKKMQLVGNYLEGFLSWRGILEHSTKGMISRH